MFTGKPYFRGVFVIHWSECEFRESERAPGVLYNACLTFLSLLLARRIQIRITIMNTNTDPQAKIACCASYKPFFVILPLLHQSKGGRESFAMLWIEASCCNEHVLNICFPSLLISSLLFGHFHIMRAKRFIWDRDITCIEIIEQNSIRAASGS